MKPAVHGLCLVLLPPDSPEALWHDVIEPAVHDAGLQPMRAAPGASRAALADRLRRAAALAAVVEHFDGVQRLKTDVFRERVPLPPAWRLRLESARAEGPAAVRAVQAELASQPGGLAAADPALAVDLLLSWRAVQGWTEMVELVAQMPPALAETPLVQEQLGLALNRAGRRDEAERVLQAVIDAHGPSSETCALLGRVHKDRWDDACARGDSGAADAWLRRAVAAYLQGFEADWRDAFPGINAVTLMELCEPPDARRATLLPVVRYAVERRLAGGAPDYWDHATRIELAVLAGDEPAARAALADALAAVRERWEPASTASTLRRLRLAREQRGEAPGWAAEIEAALDASAGSAPG